MPPPPGSPAEPGPASPPPPGHADPAIAATLARLDTIDPSAASDARAALEWLIGDRGLGALSRYGVQQFCWYELPFKWIVDPHVQLEIVHSLARFFDLAGLARYAEVSRSTTTVAVLDAWARDRTEGFQAYRRASDSSGVEPPDLPELAWAGAMLEEEHVAFWSTAMALEVAVDAGVVSPGATGWRAARVELARDHLGHPREALFGASFLQSIRTARIAAWIEGSAGHASTARAQLLAPVANALLHPQGPPRDLRRSLQPLLWWLDLVAADPAGLVLTGTGRLPRAAVLAALAEFPRWAPPGGRAPRGVDDVAALASIDRLGRDLRLARRDGRRLRLTRAGEAHRSDPGSLWAAVAADAVRGTGLAPAVTELVLAVLVLEPLVAVREVMAEVTVALTEAGWHRGPAGAPIPLGQIAPIVEELAVRAVTLGWIRERGPVGSPRWRLTAAGRAAAVHALRVRALSPSSL